MTPATSITIGKEEDPARRLRVKWGQSIRSCRGIRELSLRQLADRMNDFGCPVTAAAIGMWERGETAPRPHHQVGVCKALGMPHSVVFQIADEVA